MNIIGCRYTGTWLDHSVYGMANRVFISALYVAGVNLTTQLVVQVNEKSDYGILEEVAKSCRDRVIDYKIKIIHLTPDMYKKYREVGKYNIGHIFFETDRLPRTWVENCNKMEELWTASEKQAQMIKKSGVTVPIYWFPQPIDAGIGFENITPFEIKFKKDFTFYSVFQWIDRKNPRGIIESYWRQFEGRDDVCLLIKTYRANYSEDEFTKIKHEIEGWRKELNLKSYPKIYLVKKLLKSDEVYRLHAMGDCYVSASSGEGWSRPVAEAILMGKPVISADNGGITDYLTDEEYYKIESEEKNATQVSWIPWYTSDMKWKVVKNDSLMKAMDRVFMNRQEAERKARLAKDLLARQFNLQTVGAQMKERLETIMRFI